MGVDLALSWLGGVGSVGVDLVGVDLKAPNLHDSITTYTSRQSLHLPNSFEPSTD